MINVTFKEVAQSYIDQENKHLKIGLWIIYNDLKKVVGYLERHAELIDKKTFQPLSEQEEKEIKDFEVLEEILVRNCYRRGYNGL